MINHDLAERVTHEDLCNTCGAYGPHDCELVLLSRCRWLILHYAHRFNEADKLEALPLVDQIAGLLLKRVREGRR